MSNIKFLNGIVRVIKLDFKNQQIEMIIIIGFENANRSVQWCQPLQQRCCSVAVWRQTCGQWLANRGPATARGQAGAGAGYLLIRGSPPLCQAFLHPCREHQLAVELHNLDIDVKQCCTIIESAYEQFYPLNLLRIE